MRPVCLLFLNKLSAKYLHRLIALREIMLPIGMLALVFHSKPSLIDLRYFLKAKFLEIYKVLGSNFELRGYSIGDKQNECANRDKSMKICTNIQFDMLKKMRSGSSLKNLLQSYF